MGIKVKADKILLTVHHEYETQLITLYLLQCTNLKGQPKPLEGQESMWVRPLDLLKYTFPPPDLKFIEFLVSQGENGPFHDDMK